MPECLAATIDFIVRENDPQMQVVEDDIRKNLAEIGISVNHRFLGSDEYKEAELNGDYHLLFTRTWGAPYDPHSYMTSWAVPAHVEYSAIGNLQAPLTRDLLLSKIEKVQTELSPQKITSQWREIHEDIHKNALFLPLWGSRIPYVLNRRLIGFTPSNQAFAIPVNTIQVATGSKNATIAPGIGSLFKSTGPINPHQYSPNALWAQDWIYEGLVSYGQDGQIVPALATKWETETAGEGQRVTFQLRQGVKFHDGVDWNCDAAVLNFDHVLSDVVKQRHAWFGAGQYLSSWTCNSDFELVLETNTPFYPLLQELSYIRPLRFASPAAFAEGLDSHPDLHNSCESGDFGTKWDFLEEDVKCLGLSAPTGTGAWKFVSREAAADGSDANVLFQRNDDYWGQKPGIEFLTAVQYASSVEVEDALMAGELDMALGIGPLGPKQVQNLKFFHSDEFDVLHSDVVQNSLLVFNSNRAPTDDIKVRQAIIHAIDKSAFLESEFAGLEQPITQLLPRSAPYSNFDLNPKWDYDLDKATLLNCPETAASLDASLGSGAIAGIAIAAVVVVGLLGLIAKMIKGERSGKPVFASVEESKEVN